MSILKAIEDSKRPPARAVPADTQQTCIDLPGEAIKCVVHKPKLEVVLRKHRDVVFDIKLFKGMAYTVEATEGEFYNTRDKKIVTPKQTVKFKDGEQLRLWIGRAFTGQLILKSNGKLIGRYVIPSLDPMRYGLDPIIKPAPFIVALTNQPSTPEAWMPAEHNISMATSRPEHPLQSMHVVEVNQAWGVMPEDIADFFKKGGEDTAIDPQTKLMTRNWLWAQITAGAAYISDAALSKEPWLKDLWNQKFHLQKVQHRGGPKWYVIFKGQAGLRKHMTGTRYLSDNTKVVAITAGAGSLKGVQKASWEAAKGTFKGAAKFALVLTVVLDVAEWLADYEDVNPKTGKPRRDLYDLGSKIFTDVAWGALGACIGVALMAIATPGLVAAGLAFGGVIAVGTVLVAIGVGLGLAYIDGKVGITTGIAETLRTIGRTLEEQHATDYEGYTDALGTVIPGLAH